MANSHRSHQVLFLGRVSYYNSHGGLVAATFELFVLQLTLLLFALHLRPCFVAKINCCPLLSVFRGASVALEVIVSAQENSSMAMQEAICFSLPHRHYGCRWRMRSQC